MAQDNFQEIVQAVLAFAVVAGFGVWLWFHPSVDAAVVAGPASLVLGFYFGQHSQKAPTNGK